MNGYKNAPDIAPQIGDVVQCGLPGDTAIVASIRDATSDQERPRIVNCSFDGALHLNMPAEAMLVRTVDGREPPNAS